MGLSQLLASSATHGGRRSGDDAVIDQYLLNAEWAVSEIPNICKGLVYGLFCLNYEILDIQI